MRAELRYFVMFSLFFQQMFREILIAWAFVVWPCAASILKKNMKEINLMRPSGMQTISTKQRPVRHQGSCKTWKASNFCHFEGMVQTQVSGFAASCCLACALKMMLKIHWRLEDRGFPSFVAMASSSHRHDHRRNELGAEASWKKWRENIANKSARKKSK